MEEFKTRATVLYLAINPQLCADRKRLFLCRAKMEKAQRYATR
jgi:hypothetical protein